MKTIETVLQEQNISADVLGVDGWLLRTIPADRRVLFLKLYEKAIRAAIHPDIIQDAKKKDFFGRYVARVGEAINEMCQDHATYDAMAEFVPTKRNNVRALEHAIDGRDIKIALLESELLNERTKNDAEKKKFTESIASYQRYRDHAERMRATHAEVMRIQSCLSGDKYATPVSLPFYEVELFNGMFNKLNEPKFSRIVSMIKKENQAIKLNGNRCFIVGAIFTRAISFFSQSMGAEKAKKTIELFNWKQCSDDALAVGQAINPSFRKGMVLLVRVEGEDINRIFKIKKINSIDEKSAQKIKELENQLNKTTKKLKSAQGMLSYFQTKTAE